MNSSLRYEEGYPAMRLDVLVWKDGGNAATGAGAGAAENQNVSPSYDYDYEAPHASSQGSVAAALAGQNTAFLANVPAFRRAVSGKHEGGTGAGSDGSSAG